MLHPSKRAVAAAKLLNQDATSLGPDVPVQDTRVDTPARHRRPVPNLVLEDLSARDEAIVAAVFRHRVLTYRQIGQLVFRGRDMSAVRRRLRVLQDRGWLASWELNDRRGGHTRYISTTAAANRLLLHCLDVPQAATKLVKAMLPSRRPPLDLQGGTPKWLPHQREVNALLIALETSDREIVWASSWECPLPSRRGILVLPQPDYVVIEEIGSETRLIFGEHDRGTEPVDRFVRRKIQLYCALAAFPEVAARTFGFSRFSVHVTVTDTVRRLPIVRLRTLLDAAMRSDAPELFSFTLAGWLAADPERCRWFGATPNEGTADALNGASAPAPAPTPALRAS